MSTVTVRTIADDAALVAAGIPVSPPAVWFDPAQVPEQDGPLTFTDDGRVYGMLAPRNIDHIGLPGQRRRAPFSASGYSLFHTGQVRCDDGSLVSTGRLTMLTGHADLDLDAKGAAAHYDHSGSAVADVVAWDTPAGVMCAGAARPGVTPEQMRMAMASPPSGDWRPVEGNKLEMVAALLVNTAGFPTRRPMAASGEPLDDDMTALIAGGMVLPRIIITREDPMPGGSETTETVDTTTAAAETPAPSFEKDAVVRIPTTATLGMVASVEDGRAIVQVEVPMDELEDAGAEGRMALSASAQKRLMDSELKSALAQIKDLREEMAGMVASAQAQTRGAQTLNTLGGIPE